MTTASSLLLHIAAQRGIVQKDRAKDAKGTEQRTQGDRAKGAKRAERRAHTGDRAKATKGTEQGAQWGLSKGHKGNRAKGTKGTAQSNGHAQGAAPKPELLLVASSLTPGSA